MSIELDPDSEYIGMKLNRNADGRVVLAFGSVMAKAGDQVRYLGKNGYDWEREEAGKRFKVGELLAVERISVGHSSSRYYFKDVPSYYNAVMFETVRAEDAAAEDAQVSTERGEAHPNHGAP